MFSGRHDKTNWHRTKGNADLNTQGNGEQVETIRAGKTIKPAGNTQEEGASYLKREES